MLMSYLFARSRRNKGEDVPSRGRRAHRDGGVLRRRGLGGRLRGRDTRPRVGSPPGRGTRRRPRRAPQIGARPAQHPRATGLRLLHDQVRRPGRGPRHRRRQPADHAPRRRDRRAGWVRVRTPRRHRRTQRPRHPSQTRPREDPGPVQLRRARPRAHHRPGGGAAAEGTGEGRRTRVHSVARDYRPIRNSRRARRLDCQDRPDGERQRAREGGGRGVVRAQERPRGGHEQELGRGLGGQGGGL
mmetsp:Transcript_9117/g.36771  ORF Transcript_9117/g.36771 Transcript_9117/m.36771 type:complete len:243 (+) Transcript_9117:3-731(+)